MFSGTLPDLTRTVGLETKVLPGIDLLRIDRMLHIPESNLINNNQFESFLIFQIRRPNKSLIRSLIEDSNKRMYLIIGLLFALFIMLIYIPGVQLFLAEEIGFNFMFVFLNGLDWLICFLVALICIVSFEIVKFVARRYGITF